MENRSQQTTEMNNMNRYKSETNEALVDSAPLFASVWLALFNTLRENYAGRQFTSTGKTENTGTTNKS